MKLLITGACGHIGSHIVKQISNIKKIKEVVLIDNFGTQKYNSLFNLKKKIKYSFYNLDLSKKKLNKFQKCQYVIHCASHTNAQDSFLNKKEMFRNNLECMKNVISYCKKNKSKLIHISTASVYAAKNKKVSEKDYKFLKPQSPYAEIKLIEETLLKKDSKKLNFVSLRFGTIAGVSPGMRFHTAINKFCLYASLNEKIQIYKTAYNQYRPYLSLSDAFKVFRFCINNNLFDNNVYNALSGNFTVGQIISMIKKSRKNIKIKFVKSKIMNKFSYFVDNKKLKNLGLNLNHSIEKDIKATLRLFKKLTYR